MKKTISNPGIDISQTGITFPPNMCFEEWKEFGAELTAKGRTINFLIGDWINHGQKAFGSKYKEALKLTGMEYGHLRNIASVARSIPLANRRADLSFEQHRVVAKIKDPIDQAKWLATAKEKDLSVARLRKSIKFNRIATEKETKRKPAVRGHGSYLALIDSLQRWCQRETVNRPIAEWDEVRRATVKRDLEPLVKMYNSL